MSLSSTSTIKTQLGSALGVRAQEYFSTLTQFVTGRISRTEFDESARSVLDSQQLVQLHNALIISLFDATSHRRPPTPPPEVSRLLPKKRKRTLPYQGPELLDETLRSTRLKRWTVSMGKRERERLSALPSAPPTSDRPRPRPDTDETARERGVILMTERGDPPGSRLPLQLASVTHAPTIQHVSDRINLTAAQHNLANPNKAVSSLMVLATEAKLKQLITHALTLTSASHTVSSIVPSEPSSRGRALTVSAFECLFDLSPADLPNGSATATRLALGENDPTEDENTVLLKDHEAQDPRWQLFALLAERSTLKEALRSAS